jgi:hypothetical protein
MKINRRILTGGIPLIALFAIGGCGGGSGDSEPPAQQGDTTPPVISLQAPPGSVNRVATLTATASDNVGVIEVRFFVDGELLGSADADPFSIDWDTSGETEGDHVLSAEAEDAAGNVGQSGDMTVTVQNMLQFDVALGGEQEVPPLDTQASAEASLSVHLVNGAVEGELTIDGLDATAAHIHDAFAGTNGPILVPLDQDTALPSRFTVPAAATLDEAAIGRLLAGALYVNVHTAAQPAGALRGQILPDGFVLRFTDLSGAAEVPQVETVARGRAAVTLHQETGTLVVQAQVAGLDDADQAHVHDAYAGANGPVLAPLAQDPVDTARWFTEDATLNEAALEAFAAGRLYVNVHSPANPGGEIRGQILPEGIALMFTELSGEQEVPLITTNADGLAALTLDEAGAELTLHVNTRRFPDANAAHLHGAFAGVNGPVEIGLTQDGSEPAHWFAEEQALSSTQLDALLAGATYVNVHSPANPGGEIRGQVIPQGIIFAFGRLEGGQQVPPVETDAGGTSAVTVDPVAGMLVAHLNTSGADDAVAAHLHDGFAGSNGAIAIGLEQDPENAAHWSAVDQPLDADQLTALEAGRYYANVHTPANPDGEVRAQVAPPPVEVLFITLSGGEEVPSVVSAATGIGASTVNRETGALTLHLHAGDADDATASHIHQGYAGENGPVLIGLEQDTLDLGHWSASGEQLDGAGLDAYLAGRLYVNLHTPANPGGEIRGQIAPRDIRVLFSALDGDQVVPPVTTAASGLAATTVDLASRRLVAFINADGVDDATSAGVHEGPMGENGAEVLALEQTPMQPGQWSGISEQLDAGSFSAYRSGRLYAQVATPARPDGEIRGQIVPPDAAEFDDQEPTVELISPGTTVSDTVTLEADASDDQGVIEVRFLADEVLLGSDASAPYSIDWDTTTADDGDVTLTAEAEDLAGNVGVSAEVIVSVENGSGVTLSQIQTQVFTPVCSACHTGPTSNTLPSGMNLTSAADSHAALVGVPSIQVPAMDRVEPGDPDSSYLIHKLEGTQTVGDRMPQGGPFLEQETIDTIRQWISDGAPNN